MNEVEVLKAGPEMIDSPRMTASPSALRVQLPKSLLFG